MHADQRWTGWFAHDSYHYGIHPCDGCPGTCVSPLQLPPRAYDFTDRNINFTQPLSTYRQRRAGPTSSSHRVCSVHVDVDLSFMQQWQGPCGSLGTSACDTLRQLRVATHVADVFHQANGLFLASSLPVEFQLQGISYLTRTFPATVGQQTASTAVLDSYQTWLASSGTVVNGRFVADAVRPGDTTTFQDVCLNYLLTNVNTGTTAGRASVAIPNNGGGLCEFRASTRYILLQDVPHPADCSGCLQGW